MITKTIKLSSGIEFHIHLTKDETKSGYIDTIGLITKNKEDDEMFNVACEAIISLVLAHAISGIDVESEAYKEGLETAIDACDNEH